jgi:hypothetical protein
MPYDVTRSNAGKPGRRKHAHAATTAPDVSDDGTKGFKVWSSWLDTTGPTLYVCLDTSTGAAVWLELGASGASALDDLTDVNAPTPADGDVLAWDSTPGEWVSVAPVTPTIDWGEDADITTLDYDDVADAGALDEVARADHRHGMPSEGAGGGGHYELLMTGASPPEPIEDGTGLDWIWVFVSD